MKRVVALALVAGCAGSPGIEAVMVTPENAAPQVQQVPWPSDALLGSDGKLQVSTPFPFDSANADNLTRLAATLSELDGFGVTGSIYFPVAADVTVDEGASATVVDLDDATQPVRSFPLLYRPDEKQVVAVAPFGTALVERHAHGAFIVSGVDVHPSADMAAALDGNGPTAGKGAWPKLVAYLRANHLRPVAATAFTTQSLTDWVPKVLSDLEAMPPVAKPTRVFLPSTDLEALFGGAPGNTRPGRPPSGGVRHDAVAIAVEGTFDVPHYLSPTPGTLGLFDTSLTVKAIDHVPFLLVLPSRTSYANTPIVIFQHGINDDRKAVLEVANTYCQHGYAVLGIDELWHGSRLPGNVDKVYNLSGMPGPDGIGDPAPADAVQWFFDFRGDDANGVAPLDPRYMRDNFRQATVDLMQEVRLAGHGDWSQVAAADPSLASLTVDGSKLIYSGESFGSILGAQVMAIDPEARAAVLDVGGGGFLVDLAARSAAFAQLLQPFVSGAYDIAFDVNSPDTLPARAQLSLGLLDQVVEPGDGLALAEARDPSKHILFLEAYSDETVPNSSTESLAAAWQVTQVQLSKGSRPTEVVTFPQANAPFSSNPLHALVMLDPATHPMITVQESQRVYMPGFPPFVKLPMPVDVSNPIETAQGLAAAFADSYRQNGAPSVADLTQP